MSINVVFIDSRAANYQPLIDGLTQPAEVFHLNGESDGLSQIAARLQSRSDIDALHIISHGSQGALYLGSTELDSNILDGGAGNDVMIGKAGNDTYVVDSTLDSMWLKPWAKARILFKRQSAIPYPPTWKNCSCLAVARSTPPATA